ncbi:hypothetical protein QWZ08_08830 [Ferruginibacter paludis]|uniref:hypothetical protein n=1 Tax=Ferruginibacter paludis TaxID=1310417 RepID=UPI0025B3E013|nr:hypothetical protein [Ferruginibacter paludis]MDN3655728.1 hypothetical protein [Ferruginibacter paludis]
MTRKLPLLIVFLVFTNVLAAQQTDSTLKIYSELFTPEKLHIQTDRSMYAGGETIFYKAYVLNNGYPSTLSKTLYTDWYDATGKLIQQTEAPLLIAGAKGSFDIPKNYPDTTLHLKAYTKWMLNFDSAFIYSRTLAVYQPKNEAAKTNTALLQQVNKTTVQLYPEGGFSIADLNNTIAFKATDQAGNPVHIHGTITNQKGNILDSFATVHDGMGSFSVLLKKDENFFFNWKDVHGNTGINTITAQQQSGATLGVLTNNNSAIVGVERSAVAGKEFKHMHLLVHYNHSLRYKLDIDLSSKTLVNVGIDISHFPTGIFQCTLFNADWIPVAERIAFAGNGRISFLPTITMIKKDFSKKGRNEVEINVGDSSLTNLSLAITEASLADTAGPGIFSDLLLSSELKGTIYHPQQYFSAPLFTDSTAAWLDLVMLTNGHRRYNWQAITKGLLPEIAYPADTSYLQIKGQITQKKLLRSSQPLTVNVMLQTKDSVKKMLVLPVKRDGSFEQRNLFVYDTVKLFYSINNQKNINGAVKFYGGLMKREERKSYFSTGQILLPSATLFESNITIPAKEINFFATQEKLRQLAASKTLLEVIVKTKIKTTTQILDDYYTHGLYSGEGNNIAVDIQGDITANGRNLWNYLQSKIPGFKAVYTPGGELVPVWYLDSQGIPGTPDILLDEVPISVEGANDLDINNIAYIKAFRPPFLGSLQNGFSGVIALYSKKGYSPVYSNINNTPGLETFLLNGYSRFKEFTQPDYTDTNAMSAPDNRSTLYWNPFIITDKTNQKTIISFYNNDISKKLCLILEGINEDGKITRVIQMLE